MASLTKYNKLFGKSVLILGGSSGVGLGVATMALANGARVTISSSSPTRISTAQASLQSEFPTADIRGVPCDLSSVDLERNLESLFTTVGAVDHVVFTAAEKLTLSPLDNVTREDILNAAHMRLVAPMLLAKVARRHLSPGPTSSVTFTTGTTGVRPRAGWAVTVPMSGGLESLTRQLALELKPIRVNLVSLGLVETGFLDHMVTPEQKSAMYAAAAGRHLTGRVATVEEVAEAYVYSMKDSNCTGSVIETNSGSLLV